jgi:hypothetical protein
MSNEFVVKNGLISQGNITGTGSLVVSQNITASNITASGISTANGYVVIGEDIAFPQSRDSYYAGYSGNPAAGPSSVIEMMQALSNAIGVNDPLRFRTISSPEYYSASAWHTDTTPPPYGRLFDGNANSTVDLITQAESQSFEKTIKRFVISFPQYSRPNFVMLQSDFQNNFYGYGVQIEKQSASVWLPAVSGSQNMANGSARVMAFQLGDLFNADALRFTFTASAALVINGGISGSLRLNSIRSFGNQNYSSTIPVYTNSGSQLISNNNVGIGSVAPRNRLDVAGNISASAITASAISASNLNVLTSVGIGSNLIVGTNATIGTSLTVGTNISASGNISASVFVGPHTGSTFGTASWAQSASNAVSSQTASFLPVGTYNITSSLATNSISSSYFSGSVLSASNAFVSGTLSVNGQIVATAFSSSTIYITASSLIVGDNIITLNAATPALRYAGIEAYDSGSSTLTSLLWDSQNNYFFVSSSQANASRQIILGPTGETALSENYIPLISGSNNISSSVIYQNSGNIAIGTTVPTGSLTVENSTSTIPILSLGGGEALLDVADLYVLNSFNTSSGVGFGAKVIGINISSSLDASNIPIQRTVWSGVNSATAIVLSADDPGGGPQDNAFQIWTSNGGSAGTALTQKFSLTAEGNAGIGTTSPVNRLDVAGNISASAITASNFLGTSSWATNTVSASYLIPTNNYQIATLTASNISASGTGLFNSVGIGTTNPRGGGLHVNTVNGSAANEYSALVISANVSSSRGINIAYDATNDVGIITALHAGTGWKNITLQPVSGQVGIGVVAPVNKLDVGGNISCSIITASLFSGSHSGSTFGTASWAQSSSNAVSSSIATTAVSANALNTANSYTIVNLTASNISASGNVTASNLYALTTVGIGSNLIVGTNITVGGSTELGNALTDTVTISGSVIQTGSFTTAGSITVGANISASGNISASVFSGPHTGSTFGTASWATNSLTASSIASTSNAFVQGGNSFGTTAALGTNDANNLAFETNGTTRMTIGSGGQIGIDRGVSGLYKVGIADTQLSSNSSSSLYIITTHPQTSGSATSNNTSTIQTIYSVTEYTGSNDLQNQCIFNQLQMNGTGSASGSYRALRNGLLLGNSVALATNSSFVNTNCTNQVSPNIASFSVPTWVAGTNTSIDLIIGNSTGSITNVYHHLINSPFSIGLGGITVTNAVGVYISKQRTTGIVTNGYGIYQVDTGDLNIFAGRTRIGSTTAPVNALDVSGNISASVITASLFTGSVSGSLFGTASWAQSASNAVSSQTASFLTITNNYQVNNFTASNINVTSTGSFGYVGIGTTNPGTVLDVVNPLTSLTNQPAISGRFSSNVDGRNLIRVVNTNPNAVAAATNAGISFVAYSNTSVQPFTSSHEAQILLGATSAGGDLKIIAPIGMSFNVSASNVVMTGSSYANYGNTAMTIAATGNVGISSTAPVNKLDVGGNISASVITASLFSGSVSGSVFGTSSWATNATTANSLTTGNSYQITNLTASGNISASGFIGQLTGSVLGTSSWASTANALNSVNTYTVSGLNINTGNLTMGSATEILLSDGDQTTPGLAFNADANTGIYRVANDTIGFTTNGTLKLDINSNDISSSIPISASVFVGPHTGSTFGTSSWATNTVTASYLIPTNNYQIATLTASNISASSITGSFNGTISNASTASYLTIANSYQINNLTASAISASNFMSASNVWFGNSMVFVEVMPTGSITSPDIYFSSSAITASDVMFRIEAGARTGSMVALHIISTGSLGSIAISASRGDIVGTNFTGSIFSGSFSGNATTATTATTANALNTANSYRITNLTASNISASGTISGSDGSYNRLFSTSITASAMSASSFMSASNVWFGNSMTYVEVMPTGSLTAPDVYFSSSAITSSDVMFRIEAGARTGSMVALHIISTGSLESIAISASSGNIVGTNFTGSIFSGTSFSGSLFGTSSWAATASALNTFNSYQVTNFTASNITASTMRFSVLSGSNGGIVINSSDPSAAINPRIFYNYGNGGGGDFTSVSASTEHQSFGFNSAGTFGGTVNQQSGRTIYFFDRISSTFYGGISGNDRGFYWGTSNTAFSLKVLPPGASTVPVTIKGAAGQTTRILSVTDSADSILMTVSSSGRVGIGTSDPAATFDSNGDGILRGNVGIGGVAGTDGTATVRLNIIGTGNTQTALRFDNVNGIGTTTSAGRALAGFIRCYVNSNVSDGGANAFAANVYYIPVYS